MALVVLQAFDSRSILLGGTVLVRHLERGLHEVLIPQAVADGDRQIGLWLPLIIQSISSVNFSASKNSSAFSVSNRFACAVKPARF